MIEHMVRVVAEPADGPVTAARTDRRTLDGDFGPRPS